jgi:N-acetylmuramoyl-L-alanine amidase
VTLPDAGSTPAASTNFSARRVFRIAAFTIGLSLLFAPPGAGSEPAKILWRGNTYSIATADADFRISDAARALGFEVSSDPTTGVLKISGEGHQIFVGVGTLQVPVDQKIQAISRPARAVAGQLYAPLDFFEKVLFPLAGAAGSYDQGRRSWTLTETTPPLSLEVAVVHVEPTTQIVIKESGSANFVPTLTETGFAVRWPGSKIAAPFAERRYDDPFISVIRFAGDAVAIEFKEKGLAARAYPLSSPERVVVEVGRSAPGSPAAPLPSAPSSGVTIVIDAGHGGGETGAIGHGSVQEKDVTLQIARRLAAALPKTLGCRVVMTRDSDAAMSLDDRTSIANHEKADLFLSIHANSSRVPGAHGSETYYLSLQASDKLAQEVASQENQAGPTPSPTAGGTTNRDLDFILWDMAQSAHLKESSELAESIQRELNALSGTENRGIKQAPFRVLVGAAMPAVLVETAFISNPDEEKKLSSASFQESVADAIAKAVAGFFSKRRGVTQRAASVPTPARP